MTIPVLPPPSLPSIDPVGDGHGTEFWTKLFPWEDLQAKGIPERRLKLGQEVLGSLSIMVGNDAVGPHLIQTDAMGNLLYAPIPNQRIAQNVIASPGDVNIVIAGIPGQILMLRRLYTFYNAGVAVTYQLETSPLAGGQILGTYFGDGVPAPPAGAYSGLLMEDVFNDISLPIGFGLQAHYVAGVVNTTFFTNIDFRFRTPVPGLTS